MDDEISNITSNINKGNKTEREKENLRLELKLFNPPLPKNQQTDKSFNRLIFLTHANLNSRLKNKLLTKTEIDPSSKLNLNDSFSSNINCNYNKNYNQIPIKLFPKNFSNDDSSNKTDLNIKTNYNILNKSAKEESLKISTLNENEGEKTRELGQTNYKSHCLIDEREGNKNKGLFNKKKYSFFKSMTLTNFSQNKISDNKLKIKVLNTNDIGGILNSNHILGSNYKNKSDIEKMKLIKDNFSINNKKSKKNNKKISNNNPLNKIILNPLSIPEEDKIFFELNKYNWMDEENNNSKNNICKVNNQLNANKGNEKEKEKIKGKNVIIREKNKCNKTYIKSFSQKKSEKNKSNSIAPFQSISSNRTSPKKKAINFKEHVNLNSARKYYEVLNDLYATTSNFYNKLNEIKTTKDSAVLGDYQNNLLDLIQPMINTVSYERLKFNFYKLRKRAFKIRERKMANMTELENEEKRIIEEINDIYKKYREDEFIRYDYLDSRGKYNFVEMKLPFLRFSQLFSEKEKFNNNNNYKINYNKKKNKIKSKNSKSCGKGRITSLNGLSSSPRIFLKK